MHRVPVCLGLLGALWFTAPLQSAEETLADRIAAIRRTAIEGDGDNAREAAQELASAHPDDAKVLWLLAEILDAVGDDQADEALSRALERGKDDVEVIGAAANLWVERFVAWISSEAPYEAPRARTEAERLMAHWRDLDPNSPAPLLSMSRLLAAAGEGARALGFAQAAVARDTAHVDSHTQLWAFLGNGLDHETLAGFYEALALGNLAAGERARCLNYQAQVLARAGDGWRQNASEAARAGDESLRLQNLESSHSCYLRAIDAAHASAVLRPEWAAEVATAVLGYRVAAIAAIGAQGDFARTRLAAESARPDLESALRANATDANAQSCVEWVADAIYQSFGANENHEKGMSWLCDWWTFAAQFVTDRADWYNNIGFCGRQAKRYEESYAAYEKCIALAPQSVRYMNDTGLILLYHLHREREHMLELFQRAVELGQAQYPVVVGDPQAEPEMRSAYGDALLNLGLTLTRERRFDEAASTLETLDELDPRRVDLLAARVDLAVAQGDHDGARKLLGSALEAKDRNAVMTLYAVDETLALPASDIDPSARESLRKEIEPLLAPYRNRQDG